MTAVTSESVLSAIKAGDRTIAQLAETLAAPESSMTLRLVLNGLVDEGLARKQMVDGRPEFVRVKHGRRRAA
jgi:hypothetical protein